MTEVLFCKIAYTRYDVPWFIEERKFKHLTCLAYQVYVKFKVVVFRLVCNFAGPVVCRILWVVVLDENGIKHGTVTQSVMGSIPSHILYKSFIT
jgi:hypothetical protein